MAPRTTTSIPVASRISGFVYAIRNIVAEARRVEAAGTPVRYLNIGDPITFGFKTPPHLDRGGRAGPARRAQRLRAVGRHRRRRARLSPTNAHGAACRSRADRVVLTSGTSEGIELALTALAEAGDEVLVPVPTYPLYTAVLAKIGARAVFYRTDAGQRLAARSRSHPQPDHAGHARARGRSIRTTRPARSIRPTCGARWSTSPRSTASRSSPTRSTPISRSTARSTRLRRTTRTRRSSPSRRCRRRTSRPGWRAGWMAVGRTERLDDVLAAVKKLADGRLCATGPMEYAITAALNGDRSAPGGRSARRCATRADLTTSRLNAIDGISVVAPTAAFYAMPKVALPPGVTDEDYVLGAAARDRACSASTAPASAPGRRTASSGSCSSRRPSDLASIYDDIGRFTAQLPGRAGGGSGAAVRSLGAEGASTSGRSGWRRSPSSCSGPPISFATSCS